VAADSGRPAKKKPAPAPGPRGKARAPSAARAPAPARRKARGPEPLGVTARDRALLSTLDRAQALVVAIDAAGRLVHWNRACERLTGYTLAEGKGAHLWDLILHPDDIPAIREKLARSLTGSFPVSHESHWRARDGGERFVAWTSVALRRRDGSIRHIVSTGIDVTQQRVAEREARAIRERYADLFEHASYGIFTIEATDDRFADVNPRGCELLGYTRDELRTMRVPDLFDPDELAVPEPPLVDLRAGKAVIATRRLRRRDGSIFTAEIGSRILPDGRFISIVRDLTETVAAEAAVRRSEARYRALVEQASEGIAIVDESFRVVEANSSVSEMLGYPPGALVGMSVADLMTPEHAADAARNADLMRHAGKTGDLTERVMRRRDGSTFFGEISARLLPDGGLLAVLRDVSARKGAERALRESEARYRRLHESMTDAYVRVDMSGPIVEFNEVYRAMLGYERDELMALSYVDLTPARWHEFEARIIEEQVLPRGHSEVYEKEYRRKDGTVFPIELRTELIVDEAGAPAGMWAIVRDITQRKQVEEALREGEARYRAVVEQASEGIMLTDPEWRFLDVNPRAGEMFGYAPEEMLGMSVLDVSTPEDMAARPLRTDELRQGRTTVTERLVRRKDGTGFTAEISARALPDGRVVSVVRDVTERRRMEQALRESEERFRRVFESEMLGMVFGLQGGAVADANEYFLRLTGYSRNDLLAGRLRWNAISPVEHADRLEEAVRQAHATGRSQPFETEFIRKDGRRVPVLCGAAFIGEAQDFGVGFALDLTELKRTEQRLVESQRYLERAHELAQIGTWDADLATMKATYSDVMKRIFGVPEDQGAIPFEAFSRSIHPEDWPKVERIVQLQMQGGGAWNYEHRVVRPDGSVRVIEVTSEPVLDDAGRAIRIIGSVQDITERRHLEQQLREAQKLEAIGRLAGGVAHDFNNLLTVILGFTETMLESLPPGDDHHTSAEQIRTAARRAAGLTQQLLAFGRRQVFQLQVFDLNLVLGEMRGILQRLIGERIEIVLSLDPRPTLLRADRGQIEQVVLNLALNARDAMPARGRLSILTSHHGAATGAGSGRAGGPWLLLTVSDTGVGMSPEVQAHIFEPFYTTKEVGHGTGLGLATVYGIVTQSGGHIEVSSTPGVGSTFRIYLPASAGAVEAEAGAPAAVVPGGMETVLLVEEERAVRALMAQMLRRRGYYVLEAGGAEEALALAGRHDGAIHLLATDLVMPGLSGRELARRLSGERQGLRVLFVSGYSDERAVPRESGGAPGAYLQKPFTPVIFARKVRELLDAPPPPAASGPAAEA
jgi:PAS domain S-box-containing protein